MRVSEVYASVQGEGPRVGRTTVFVRFGGCNLRCPGWPCDTQHAIQPEFRKEWEVFDPTQLADRVIGEARRVGATMITLTGGEPFLQKSDELKEFCQFMAEADLSVECFSNARLLYPQWVQDRVSFIVDWKLPGSGEWIELIPSDDISIFQENLALLAGSDLSQSVKFVCKDPADFEAALSLWSLLDEGFRMRMQWYYGIVWNGDISNADLVDLVMTQQLPWKLNVQVHNHIWDPQERGR